MPALQRYLAKRAVTGSWRLEGQFPRAPRGVVVIPSLNEGAELFATLDSLDRCAGGLRRDFAVVVVVNRSEVTSEAKVPFNRSDMLRLVERSAAFRDLPLAWVDAHSPGRALPVKDAGVGLARKLGFDLALAACQDGYRQLVLASLDADTRVAPDYLEALAGQFADGWCGGCVIPFRHRDPDDEASRDAIECYELYQRAYVEGLRTAGSPYAYHAIGSALACSGEAYVKAGGMNRRKAGEDFYFLQQLTKTSRVVSLRGGTVFPSARISRRTPFGTGRVVERQLAGEEAVRFYAPEAFRVLRGWLALVSGAGAGTLSGDALLKRAHALDALLAEYLERLGLVLAWERLRRNHSTEAALAKGFHAWFDALRSVQLLHALESRWPRSRDPGIVARQFGWSAELSVTEMLVRLRQVQGG